MAAPPIQSLFTGLAAPSYPPGTKRNLDFADSKSYQPGIDTTFTDFKIMCGSKTFDVHRNVICAHSQYIKRLCTVGFTGSTRREVTLMGDFEQAVAAMVRYFYTFDLERPSGSVGFNIALKLRCTLESFLCHLSAAFNTADKYIVPGLKDLVREKFEDAMQRSLFATTSLARAERIASAFLDAVPNIWQDGPPSDERLHKLVLERFVEEDKCILARCNKGAFDQVVLDVPEFARDLLHATSGVMTEISGEKSD